MLLAAARRSLFATARTRLASFTASASRRRLCTAPPESSPGLVGHIMQQVQSELANATKTSAHFYGFFGACCNWFLGISAVYDASTKGPEVISLKMTGVMLAYSTLFGAWAGWAVMPRNFILAGSHIFNVLAQSNQMRRCLEYKMANDPGGAAEVQFLEVRARRQRSGQRAGERVRRAAKLVEAEVERAQRAATREAARHHRRAAVAEAVHAEREVVQRCEVRRQRARGRLGERVDAEREALEFG